MRALEDPTDRSLLEVWDRTGFTGRGRGILERKTEPSEALLAFLADARLPVPMAKSYVTRNDSKEKRGKTLNYDREPKEIREGLDCSRQDEWDKWTACVVEATEEDRDLSLALVGSVTCWKNKDKSPAVSSQYG